MNSIAGFANALQTEVVKPGAGSRLGAVGSVVAFCCQSRRMGAKPSLWSRRSTAARRMSGMVREYTAIVIESES